MGTDKRIKPFTQEDYIALTNLLLHFFNKSPMRVSVEDNLTSYFKQCRYSDRIARIVLDNGMLEKEGGARNGKATYKWIGEVRPNVKMAQAILEAAREVHRLARRVDKSVIKEKAIIPTQQSVAPSKAIDQTIDDKIALLELEIEDKQKALNHLIQARKLINQY